MRIILVTSRHPLPPWRGNQIRTLQWLDALEEHERVLICPAPDDRLQADTLTGRVTALRTYPLRATSRFRSVAWAVWTGRPVQEGLYGVSAAREAVRKEMEVAPADLMIVQMVRCGWALEAARSVSPGVPVLHDAIDSMSLHFERAALSAPRVLRPALRCEAARCRHRERWLFDGAAVTTAVARRDLDRLCPEIARGRLVPVASVASQRSSGEDRPPSILLSGNLGYRPTVDAALWFARRVWARLTERVPEVRWVLAGARPSRRVRNLAALPGVEVHGNVSDLQPFLATASVAVAPMASGSGVPMKVLEAWAAGLPVVVDPWTAAGLESDPEAGVAVADDADGWVSQLECLLTDREAANELARKGRAVWDRYYSPERVSRAIRDAVRVATS